jgi:hypothetical protein
MNTLNNLCDVFEGVHLGYLFSPAGRRWPKAG